MACEIHISSIKGEESSGPGTGLDSLVISGTAAGCKTVCVTFHQTSPSDITLGEKCTDVDADGHWTATFTAPADFKIGDLLCGVRFKYEISARCRDSSDCKVTDETNQPVLLCGDCPVVNVDDVQIQVSTDCHNGQRSVTISGGSVQSTGGLAGAHGELQQPDGTVVFRYQGVFPQAGATLPLPWQTINVDPGSYKLVIVVDVPAGCSGTTVKSFDVRSCPQTSPCPFGPIVSTVLECNPEGRRRVDIAVTLQTSVNGPFSASLRDPSNVNVTIDSGQVTSGTLTLHSPPDFTLAPGDYTVRVDVTEPKSCPPILDDLTVGPCPRPPRGGGGAAESFGCVVLRILGLAALFVGLALTVAGLATSNTALCLTGEGIAAFGVFLLFLWVLICAREATCLVLQRFIELLEILLLLIGIVAVFAAVQSFIDNLIMPCLLIAVDGVFVGIVLDIANRIFRNRRCVWRPDLLDDFLGG